MSRQPYMSFVCISTRSAGAIGLACSTAMTCQACLGPTTNSKAASAIRGAACCGPRAKKASRSARCNAKAPGNSYRGPQQRRRYSMRCATLHRRTWLKNGNALLRIAIVFACRADHVDRSKRNSITCVRSGRRYSLQVQGDFCATANNQRLINPLEAEVDESARLIESTGMTPPYKISRFHRESPLTTPAGGAGPRGPLCQDSEDKRPYFSTPRLSNSWSCIRPLRIIHSTPNPATMSPLHHHLRGHGHGTTSLLLPPRSRSAGVRLPDALLAVAQRRRFPSPANRANHAIPTQALQGTQTV